MVLGQNVALEMVVTGPWGCLSGLREEVYYNMDTEFEVVESGGGGVL